MIITAIDDRQTMDIGWVKSMWTWDYISIDTVQSLVDGVDAKTGGQPLCSELHINDHGNMDSFSIGDDWVTNRSFAGFKPEFVRLGGFMRSGGFIILRHCLVGHNEKLIKRLAKHTGVDVYASTKLGTLKEGWRADPTPCVIPLVGKEILNENGTVRSCNDLWSAFEDPAWIRFEPGGSVIRGVSIPTPARFVPTYEKVMP